MKNALIIFIAILIAACANVIHFSYFSMNIIHSMIPLLIIGELLLGYFQ